MKRKVVVGLSISLYERLRWRAFLSRTKMTVIVRAALEEYLEKHDG